MSAPAYALVEPTPVSPPTPGTGFAAWLDWAVTTFGAELAVSCSLSVEDALVVDEVAAAVARHGLPADAAPHVFVLDTGRLHEESHQALDQLRARYPLRFRVRVPHPDDLEPLVQLRGTRSFYESIEARKACCDARKVAPLRRALAGAAAWVTGLRRAQSPTRRDLVELERDDAFGGLWKVNPLIGVDDERLWAEVRARDLVVHPLYRAGFPSIGCAPCTRAVAPGEDARAGRWWWEDPTTKECGLHGRAGAAR